MPKIRVLVVDDSIVIRRLVSDTLGRDPQIEVIATAPNGKIALAKIIQTPPDLITLDIEMPDMDGIATLRELRKTHPKLPVIMFSTLTQRGGVATLDALAAGASDYVTKPSNSGNLDEAISKLQSELIPKIKILCRSILGLQNPLPFPLDPPRHTRAPLPIAPRSSPGTSSPIILRSPSAPRPRHPIQLLCIGSSTGGPNALADFFRAFTAPLPIPVLIVQHMPPVFTQMLAERLNNLKNFAFSEGTDGEALKPGRVYIAPGGRHMEIHRPFPGQPAFIKLHDGPPENSCRPAVDVLFRSIAATYGGNVLALILTGMGQDGLHGCASLYEHGARILAQDEATSVVWGMPGYIAQSGMADKVLPLPQIAPEIIRQYTTGQL